MIIENPVICSSGAFSHGGSWPDHRRIPELSTRLNCDGLEIMVYEAWSEPLSRIASDLDRCALPVMSVHTEKSLGPLFGSDQKADVSSAVTRLRDNVRFAADLGAPVAVVHLWDRPLSDRNIHRNIETLSRALDAVADLPVTICVESLPCRNYSPLRNLREVHRHEERCCFTFDTEFLSLHNELFEALASELPLAHVHIKDSVGALRDAEGTRLYTHPGEGKLDLLNWLGRLGESAYGGAVTLETPAIDHRDGSVDIARLQRSLEYIRTALTGYSSSVRS